MTLNRMKIHIAFWLSFLGYFVTMLVS